MEAPNRFHWVDYVVFVIMLIASLGIGLWHTWKGKRKTTTEEYLMGGRQLQLIPVTLSMVVSVVSTNTMLGVPAEAFSYGIQFAFISIGVTLATIFVGTFLVPLMFPLKMTSAHEYLELRFNSKAVRWFGTATFLITQVLYIGCVIFGPAIALQTVTGLQPWISIMLVSVIGTGYTAVGGIKAVIWTDTFQAVIMVIGLVTVIILGTISVGGFDKVIDINKEWGRIFVDTSWDPTKRFTLWSMVISITVYWIGGYGINQPSLQRYCAMTSQRKARIAVYLNGPLFTFLVVASTAAGMVAFAYFAKKKCDPLEAGIIDNSNQILPLFVMEVMNYPGLVGLFMSSLFCASLSTVSSSLNSMSAVVWEDLLKSKLMYLSEYHKTIVTKVLVVVLGVICTAVSYLVLEVGGNLVQISMSFFGAAIGPLTGTFLLGAIVPFANWKGAFCGGMVSLAINLWLTFGQVLAKGQRNRLPSPTVGCTNLDQDTQNITTMIVQSTTPLSQENGSAMSPLAWLYSVSFVWYSLIGVFVCMFLGTIISLVSGCRMVEKSKHILLFDFVKCCMKNSGGYDVEPSIKMRNTTQDEKASRTDEIKVLTDGQL